MDRSHFEPDLDRGRAERVVGLLGLQMRDRQRRAADVQRERADACENPEPPGRVLFVEVSHHKSAVQGFVSAGAGKAAASGTPSSATSASLE